MEQLLITTMPEAQTRLSALSTGEVDIAEPPLPLVKQIRERGELDIYIAGNTGQNVFFQFTTNRPPFDDVRARQAVAYGTDAAEAMGSIYGDLSEVAWCPYHNPNMFSQDTCRKMGYEYNPEKARALMAELGYTPENPVEVHFLGWTGGERDKIMEIYQSQLAEIGIDADVQVMDIGSFNARVRQENEKTSGKGSFDMMTWSWYDPDILYQLHHSPGAYRGYTSDTLDRLLEKTRTTIEPGARKEAFGEVFEYLLGNAVHLNQYSPGWEWVFALRPEVEGFYVGPFLHPYFNDVKMGQ